MRPLATATLCIITLSIKLYKYVILRKIYFCYRFLLCISIHGKIPTRNVNLKNTDEAKWQPVLAPQFTSLI